MTGPRKKLSVVFLFDDSLDSADGVANQVKTLGGWLSARGHKVSYFCGETKMTSWKGGKVYSLAKNVPVRFNGNWLSIPLPASRSKISQALVEARPDVMHVQMPHSPFMSQVAIGMAKNVPVAGTFHIYPSGIISRAGARLLRLLYLRNLNAVGEVVSVSSAAQNFATAAFGIKSTIVPNMVDISSFASPKVRIEPGKVVFLGRLVERKGCKYLIQAFATIARAHPGARLVIAGDGPQRAELEKLAKNLGLSRMVEFKGRIEEGDKAALLASAQVACFPSVAGESFGVVLIEAMAAGAGVVLAGNNPGYRSVLGTVPQSLFNPDNTQELADKVSQFLKSGPQFDELHRIQSQLVRQFDVSKVGPQVEELYARLIAKHAKSRHN